MVIVTEHKGLWNSLHILLFQFSVIYFKLESYIFSFCREIKFKKVQSTENRKLKVDYIFIVFKTKQNNLII